MLHKTTITVWSEHRLDESRLREDIENMLNMSGTCTVRLAHVASYDPTKDADFTDSDAQIFDPQDLEPLDEEDLRFEKAANRLWDLGLPHGDVGVLSGSGAKEWLAKGGDPFQYGISADNEDVRAALQEFVDSCEELNDIDRAI